MTEYLSRQQLETLVSIHKEALTDAERSGAPNKDIEQLKSELAEYESRLEKAGRNAE